MFQIRRMLDDEKKDFSETAAAKASYQTID